MPPKAPPAVATPTTLLATGSASAAPAAAAVVVADTGAAADTAGASTPDWPTDPDDQEHRGAAANTDASTPDPDRPLLTGDQEHRGAAADTGASTPGPDRPLLTGDQIQEHRSEVVVTRQQAHRYLDKCRKGCAHQPVEGTDLSFERDFDWRRYLCQHPMAQEIIGSGVWKFECRFLNGWEPNAAKLMLPPPFGQHRFDFVVHRIDGKAVRMHPSAKADAKVIVGDFESWRWGGARASTPGAAQSVKQGLTFDTLGRVDVLSNANALERAMILHREATCAEVNMDDWELDLLGDPFAWDRWLLGRPWGAKLVEQTISTMSICMHNGSFCITVITNTYPDAPRHITLGPSGSRLK